MIRAEILTTFYQRLLDHFGPQHWWPAATNFEMIVGAILTQNTSWKNVSKAISHLRKAGMIRPKKLLQAEERELAQLLRPAGYYNLKASRLKGFIQYLFGHHRGSLSKMLSLPPDSLRRELLAVKGIGKETADCILLYAGGHPSFVVDTYTRRVLLRHGLIPASARYEEIQHLFHRWLPGDAKLYGEYHALLVEVGKRFCRKVARCSDCPLEPFLKGST